MTNSIGVFAAKERDQSEMESTVETKEQRQVRREQACENLERQNAERREDRLRVHARETRASERFKHVKIILRVLYHSLICCIARNVSHSNHSVSCH